MANVIVGHHPELTNDKAMPIFEREFGGKYEVYKHHLWGRGRHLAVKKSTWVEGLVRVEQKADSTRFDIRVSFSPSVLTFPILITPAWYLLGWVFLRPKWQELESEVVSFVSSAPEFS